MPEYVQELRDAINKFTEDYVWHVKHHLHQIIKPE